MLEILEILAAVLAVFGAYTILDMLRVRLLYPMKVRRCLRAAVMLCEESELREISAYAAYLRREQKISPERLIILANDGIIIDNDSIARHGELCRYIKCKELSDNDGFTDLGEEP